MPRTISFTVPDEYNNRKVVHFLRGSARLSVRLINSLKRVENGITLNGAHTRTVDLLRAGDVLAVCIPDDECLPEPVRMPLDILFEDADVLCINKPPTLAMHPTHNHQGDTLANGIAHYLEQQGRPAALRAIGRLDKGTSGVVVCALNKYAASRLTGGIQKDYLALVAGVLQGGGTIDTPIGRPDARKTLRACVPDGERAVTHWTALGTADGRTLLRVRPDTGRTHQIRVHFAHAGYPLIGDAMYGGSCPELGHQLLHCERAAFTHPVTGEGMTIVAPMPEDMARYASNIIAVIPSG